MYAQWLITLLIVVGFGFALWKMFGKQIVEKFAEEESEGIDISTLERKIEELREKEGELERLKNEIGTTKGLNKVNTQLKKLREQLAELEKKQEKQTEGGK